ncbi:unnamed protein product [Eretmochelys imbricata]
MAEKGPCPGLDASLRSEDLLSDMEPLPLSAPATPAQPFGSEVTAQLYASLHRSRQAELDACSQLQPPDLEALAEELSRTLSAGVEASARRKQGGESRHVAEMETVRSRLRTMLQDSRELPPAGGALGLGTVERKDDDDSFESDSTTALLAARPLQELSPPGSACGLEELFPRYASLRLGTPREPVPATEPLLLKEALAKERARRKVRGRAGLPGSFVPSSHGECISGERCTQSVTPGFSPCCSRAVQGSGYGGNWGPGLLGSLPAGARPYGAVVTGELGARTPGFAACWSQAARGSGFGGAGSQDSWAFPLLELGSAGQWLRRGTGSQDSWVRCLLERAARGSGYGGVPLPGGRAAEAQRAADAQQVLASAQADSQRLESELEAVRSERDGLQMEISLVKGAVRGQKAKLEAELKVALEQQVTERLARGARRQPAPDRRHAGAAQEAAPGAQRAPRAGAGQSAGTVPGRAGRARGASAAAWSRTTS